jgi:hypothetical protein
MACKALARLTLRDQPYWNEELGSNIQKENLVPNKSIHKHDAVG